MSMAHQLQRITIYGSDPAGAVPHVLFGMYGPNSQRLIQSACFQALNYFSAHSNNYVFPHEHSSESPPNYGLKVANHLLSILQTKTRIQRIDWAEAYRTYWCVELLGSYAFWRNSVGLQAHVGDEPWLHPLIYATLHTLHEWRVEAIRGDIARGGPDLGSDTAWFRQRFDKEVKDWPEKFGFGPRQWTALPLEDMAPYSSALAEYNVKKKQELK